MTLSTSNRDCHTDDENMGNNDASGLVHLQARIINVEASAQRTQYGQPLAITIMPAMYDITTTDASVEQVLGFSIVTTDYDYSHLQ